MLRKCVVMIVFIVYNGALNAFLYLNKYFYVFYCVENH